MQTTWVVLAVVATLVAAHATQFENKVNTGTQRASSSLEKQVAKVLDDFKAIMKTGRTDFNIPVLDPAVVSALPMDIKHGPFNAKIVATDSQVKGVSDFTVTKIEQVDGTNKVNLDLEVPEIDITGNFDMKGKVKIGIISKTINDKGPLALSVKGPKLSATVEIQDNNDGSYNVKTVSVGTWKYESIKIQLDNLLGGGGLGKIANKLFNQIFPTLVESDRPMINNWMEIMTRNVFNKFLDGLAGKKSANLEAKLKELSEAFRAAMKTGRPDLNLPVMDPAVVTQLPIHVHQSPFDAQLVASDIKVSGASQFQFTTVTQVIGTNKFAVDFVVPAIHIDSQYSLATEFKLGFIKFDSNYEGPLTVSIEGLKGSARAELIVDTDNELSLQGLEVDYWTYDSIKVEVNDLSSGGFIKRTLNNLINKLVPSLLVKPHVDDLSAWAADRGAKVISRFLDAVAGRVVVSHLDTKVTALLEQLKGVMKQGSDAFQMPVLDPTTFDQIPAVGFDANVLEVAITGKEIQITGTSEYTTKISQIEGTNQVQVEIDAPEIFASGKFDVDGKIKISLFKVPIEDHGSVKVTIKGLKTFATATVAEDISGFLSLKGLKIDDWTYSEIKAEFSNLQDAVAGRVLNMAINKLLPLVINTQKDTLTAWSEVTARSILDRFLAGIAAQPTSPVVRIERIPDEAREIMTKLAVLAVGAGLAA